MHADIGLGIEPTVTELGFERSGFGARLLEQRRAADQLVFFDQARGALFRELLTPCARVRIFQRRVHHENLFEEGNDFLHCRVLGFPEIQNDNASFHRYS